MLVITLLNGMNRVYTENTVSLLKVAEDIKKGLGKISVGAIVNKNFVHINTIINKNSNVCILTMKDKQSISFIQRSCIQLLSYACKKKWPYAKIGIGNIFKEGFYCDIDINDTVNKKDILDLEVLMKKLINKKYFITYYSMLKKDLKVIFKKQGEIYKLEYIKKYFHDHDMIDVYYHEKYLDISLGAQSSNIKFCTNFKLQNCSGAYWEGSKFNNMLQRIYGTVWLNNNQLLQYLNNLEAIKNKDHRLINKKMKLYHIQEEASGMIFWHNNGLIIFQELKNFIRCKLREAKYEEVKTPIMMHKSMWEISGHVENFKDSIFSTMSEYQEYFIKPMNCPAHIQIFNCDLKSYRDLPVRMSEFGICHRNESSGSLHGLMRLRNFTQDDAHIFCTENQVQIEIINCIKMIFDVYKVFNFKKIHINLSTRPKKRIGNDKIWDKSEQDLKNALLISNLNFQIQNGEGAFYGPKIEFILEDSLSRLWQCGTIQLDFYLPKRFSSFYIDHNNNRKTPVMIHRAILGSIERFIGILLEEYSGFLPTWLSPVQVVVINVNMNHNEYVIKIMKKLFNLGIRVKYDIKNEKINFKIRKYTIERIPYILICGDQEIKLNKISIRNRSNKTIKLIDIDIFIKKLQFEIQNCNFYQMEE
ncbi:Threonine--tRNA ligase [Buchnera aphidicola (Phyllaphis fagi)]|uniref:threonine--tRNA ligase n=1 Tax=Buchnera aphidicola TaxID=9 RepID=UPI00346432E8